MIEDLVLVFLLAMQPSIILLQASSNPNRNASETSIETFFLDEFGSNEFEETLISFNRIFVDKTMFIVELIDRVEKCEVISRPSRWGKTFNMAMTASFFDIPHHKNGSVDEHKRNVVRSLFAGGAKIVIPIRKSPIEMKPLKISKIESAMDEIANHPTVFLSFANTGTTYEAFLMNFAAKIRGLIVKRNYAAFLPQYCEFYEDPELCNELLNSTRKELKSYPHAALNQSIEILTCLLARHFKSQTVILIDEFDYPLNRMKYDSEDFNKTTEFLKSLIGWTFKGSATTTKNIYRGVMTGVLQFSRLGVSTGMTVCRDCSVLQPQYSEHFGFTEEDIQTLHENNPKFPLDLSQLKSWYDGYTFGESRLYNPVSIRRCFISRRLGGYWVESVPLGLNPRHGENPLNQPFMMDLYQSSVQQLFVNESMEEIQLVSETDYKDATKSLQSFLSLLTSLGYLTYENPPKNQRYKVLIPNKEVHDFAFKHSIDVWTMKYVSEGSKVLQTILVNILRGFRKNEIAPVQDGLSKLFSKIKETAPAECYCDIIFGMLTKFDDEWDLERSFDEVITIYEQVTFQCSITLRLKLDNCYNTNPMVINFIVYGDSTMEQNITEAKTPTSTTVAHIPKQTLSIQKQCTERQTKPTINRSTTGFMSTNIQDRPIKQIFKDGAMAIKEKIKDEGMAYSKKMVTELMEKANIKAAELIEKSKIKAAELKKKCCDFIWFTCVVVGKKILGMFRHIK